MLHWPGRRLLVQRGDAELVVRDLSDLNGEGPEIRFPAPWPGRYGAVAVSPEGDVAVFAGVHALRAVGANGAVRWEIRHGCWSPATCTEAHASFAEYADDYWHGRADIGSAAFSSDGKLLWAHVRNRAGHDVKEEWLIVDPVDGTVSAPIDGAGRLVHGLQGSDDPPPVEPAGPGLTQRPPCRTARSFVTGSSPRSVLPYPRLLLDRGNNRTNWGDW